MRALPPPEASHRGRSSSSGNLALAPRDIVADGLAHALLEGGWLIALPHLLPQVERPVGRRARAAFAPRLEVRPVRQDRAVKGGLVAGKRMGRSEEMPARRDAPDGIERQLLLAKGDRLQDLSPAAQQFGIHD